MIIFPYLELALGGTFILVLFILLWIAVRREHTKNVLSEKISFPVTSALDLNELTANLFKALNQAMRVSKGYIVVLEHGTATWAQGFRMEATAINTESLYTMIIEMLEKQTETIFETRALQHEELKKFLKDKEIELMIPLVVNHRLSGMLLVGKKEHGSGYSKLEKEVLKNVEPVITVSLKNAVAYQKLAEITATIDSKIKESDDAVNSAKQKMVAMDASKDEFISIASHELRTPITAIKGYLWLTLNQTKQVLNPEIKKNVETCYHSAERLLRMVSDMLTVSRMDENKMALNIQKVDISSLLMGIHEELKPVAATREIEFTVKTAKPSIMMEADRERLQELLHNVIDNALKFVPHRGVVSIELQENGDRDVSILVRDNGPGIPKENRDKLFTKFGKIQYAYDKTHAVEGAGLGLFISKKIVDLHSGIISVESEVDKGTTFIITLPLHQKK